MGYLLNKMEKLAKETERSLKDKVALGAGAAAGAGLGASAVGAPLVHRLTDAVMRYDPEWAKELEPWFVNKNALQRALMKSYLGTALVHGAGSQMVKNVRDAYRSSPEKGLKRLKPAGEKVLHIARVLHHITPKKVKLLTALGLPITAAAGYGGYKATDAMLGG